MDAAKWSKVFEQDLSALKNVTTGPGRIQVWPREGRDVDPLLKGRQV
jgi:hypothetical protein